MHRVFPAHVWKIGCLESEILVLRALAFPEDAVLGQVGPEEFHGTKRRPEAKTIPGVVIYRFSGPLFFANCEVFRKRAEELIEMSPDPLHGFILDASAIFTIDLTAGEVLEEFYETLRARGIQLIIANLRDNVRDILVRGWETAVKEKGLFAVSIGESVRKLRVI